MTAPLRIGLIGAGSIAAYHVEGLRAAGEVVQAVAARSPASAARAAGRFGIPDHAADWRRLVERRDLDALIVATPDATHESIALAAIAAGRPVLVQKPLSADSAGGRRIVAAGRAAGVPLFTSYMHRHFPETIAWRTMRDDEPFGPVLSARLRNATPGPDWGAWFFDAAAGGGVVAQLGVHGIDLVEHLIGPIAEVQAMTGLRRGERRLADGGIVNATAEDHAMAVYRTAAGVLVSHEMCYAEVAGTDRFVMELTCERAKVVFRGPHAALAVNDGAGWTALPVGDEPAGRAQHRTWSRMLRGEAPHDGSDIAGLQGLLIAEAVRDAAAGGASVRVARASDLLAEPTA